MSSHFVSISCESCGCFFIKRVIDIPSHVHFANGHKSWVWASLMPGARNSILVSRVDVRNSHIWTITLCFPGALAGKWSSLDLNLHPDMRCGRSTRKLNALCHNIPPWISVWHGVVYVGMPTSRAVGSADSASVSAHFSLCGFFVFL